MQASRACKKRQRLYGRTIERKLNGRPSRSPNRVWRSKSVPGASLGPLIFHRLDGRLKQKTTLLLAQFEKRRSSSSDRSKTLSRNSLPRSASWSLIERKLEWLEQQQPISLVVHIRQLHFLHGEMPVLAKEMQARDHWRWNFCIQQHAAHFAFLAGHDCILRRVA